MVDGFSISGWEKGCRAYDWLMPEMESQQIYRQDARSLGELGRLLARLELPRLEVRLPRAVAEQAVAAWERQEAKGPLDPETFEQHVRGIEPRRSR